jgi:hypothetical protein
VAELSHNTDIDVEFEIIPFDLTEPGSWSVPAESVFAVRIFSPWEATKLSLFTDQGFEILELRAPPAKLSASDIRHSLSLADSEWKSLVAPSAINVIQAEWDYSNSTKVSA